MSKSLKIKLKVACCHAAVELGRMDLIQPIEDVVRCMQPSLALQHCHISNQTALLSAASSSLTPVMLLKSLTGLIKSILQWSLLEAVASINLTGRL